MDNIIAIQEVAHLEKDIYKHFPWMMIEVGIEEACNMLEYGVLFFYHP